MKAPTRGECLLLALRFSAPGRALLSRRRPCALQAYMTFYRHSTTYSGPPVSDRLPTKNMDVTS